MRFLLRWSGLGPWLGLDVGDADDETYQMIEAGERADFEQCLRTEALDAGSEHRVGQLRRVVELVGDTQHERVFATACCDVRRAGERDRLQRVAINAGGSCECGRVHAPLVPSLAARTRA